MAKQRYVSSHFWDDSYIVTLSPVQKLLFLYFLTSPLSNVAGAYEISLRRMSFDTGLDVAEVMQILSKFAQDAKIIFRNDWVLIVNFAKHQAVNPNIEKGIQEVVKCCPAWIKEFFSKGLESLSKPLNYLDLNLDLKETIPNGIGEVSVETPAPPRKPTSNKNRDLRADHVAIKMVRALVTRFPHKDLWDRIIREIGDNPDAEFFRQSYELWRSVNGNPVNLEKWLFEPNKTKKLPEIYGANNGTNKQPNQPKQTAAEIISNRPYYQNTGNVR